MFVETMERISSYDVVDSDTQCVNTNTGVIPLVPLNPLEGYEDFTKADLSAAAQLCSQKDKRDDLELLDCAQCKGNSDIFTAHLGHPLLTAQSLQDQAMCSIASPLDISTPFLLFHQC
jgi:hypothetical protein